MSPLLECRDLTMRFGGLTALNALSLDVAQGEVVGLIGPNGSGKTTFFNVTTGLYRASGGSLRFDGADIAGASAQQVYRSGVARTFQRSRLCLPLTVFDNIMIGNHRHLDHSLRFNLFRRRAFAREVERNVAAAQALLATFNPALVPRLFDAAGSVSMIDRRRVEICRALVGRPKLLLLDEPSAGMTHEETRALMDDILQVKAHDPALSIVLIEHEMGVIERVTDRCVVLNFGQKICEGSYREIAADPRVQEAYLGTA